jgi:hypothetical protein
MSEQQNLIDFEDSIRLEALPLSEGIELKKNSPKEMYVVGEGIREYLPRLSSLGFKNLWDELGDKKGKSVKSIFRGIMDQPNPRGGNALLMYAYIDYVLDHTESDLMIFLPPKSRIIAEEYFSGPTHDEIIRALEKFPKKSDRIHFVTGLFDVSPTEFDTLIQNNTQSENLK